MRKLVAASALVLLFAPAPALAQRFAVAGHVGTLGVGGGILVGVTPKLNVRGLFGFVPGEPTLTAEDIDFDLEFPTFVLTTLDYYPMNGFHLSAGGLFLSKEGDLTVTGSFEGKSVEFGGETYTGSADDKLVGTFSMKSFQPYAGIGFGNGVGKRVGLSLDVGVGFGQKPIVNITPEGPLADDPDTGPTYKANVEAEEQDIADAIPEFLKFYPVLALSLSIGL